MTVDSRSPRDSRLHRLAAAAAVMLVLGPALAACSNTIEGLEKDSRKVFGTAGGTPATGRNPTASNAKPGWQNPQ